MYYSAIYRHFTILGPQNVNNMPQYEQAERTQSSGIGWREVGRWVSKWMESSKVMYCITVCVVVIKNIIHQKSYTWKLKVYSQDLKELQLTHIQFWSFVFFMRTFKDKRRSSLTCLTLVHPVKLYTVLNLIATLIAGSWIRFFQLVP